MVASDTRAVYAEVYNLGVGEEVHVLADDCSPGVLRNRLIAAIDRWQRRQGTHGTAEQRRYFTSVQPLSVLVRRLK